MTGKGLGVPSRVQDSISGPEVAKGTLFPEAGSVTYLFHRNRPFVPTLCDLPSPRVCPSPPSPPSSPSPSTLLPSLPPTSTYTSEERRTSHQSQGRGSPLSCILSVVWYGGVEPSVEGVLLPVKVLPTLLEGSHPLSGLRF